VREESRTIDGADVSFSWRTGSINSDFSIGADVSGAPRLRANTNVCFQGVILVGDGFRLDIDDLKRLKLDVNALPAVVRPTMSGKDVSQRARGWFVIDFSGLDEDNVRDIYPRLYQHVYEHVRPGRLQNRDRQRREKWWLFGRSNEAMRRALNGLQRFIVTVETSKHKLFTFVDGEICPDHKLYAIASDDAWVLGVLSSRAHLLWALSAGGRLGVGNDPTWTNTTCFMPFPFPERTGKLAPRIRALAEKIYVHRRTQQQKFPRLTFTDMYNVLDKLRAGEKLKDKEQGIREDGLISVLLSLHDSLDAAVFDAYGWPQDLRDEQILEKLVVLNAERVEEERRGLVRWLRPEFQNPTSAPKQDFETSSDTRPGVAKSKPPVGPGIAATRSASARSNKKKMGR